MPSNTDNQEALREALLNLDRLRKQEKSARLQMETLVEGLQVLNDSQMVGDMYREILECLNRLIEYDYATILVEPEDGFLTSAFASDARSTFSRVPIKGVFERGLNGRAATLTNLSLLPEWPDSQCDDNTNDTGASNGAPLKSALIINLPTLSDRMMLVCASEQQGKFKRKELDLLKSFAPLAVQAVRRSQEMAQLNYLANTLEHQAHFDLLTGLPNRNYYERRLQELDDGNEVYSLLFVDLDNFKTINDTFGHAAGDILLSEIAFRMSAVVSDSNIVARMGGDEFSLIIQYSQPRQSVENLCIRLLDAIREPLYLRNSRIIPTASIGVLHTNERNIPRQQKMLRADIAMYGAKRRGRNCYCFFNENMESRVQTEFDIESKLPFAIKQRQFHLVYQPIFDSKSFECNRLEVLARWGKGHETIHSPAQFIPIAEKTGAIVELGEWILQQSLEEIRSWLDQTSNNLLCLNLSPVQLQRSDYSDRFLSQVKSANVDCRQLELELSENFIAESIDKTLSDNLKKLKQHGVRFAFDDFGTGKSSLLHIQKFPGTCLKIDKTFIDNIAQSDDQRRLIAGMIDFSHHLDLDVVAEGVETEQQLDILCELGTDYIQGYLLAKPACAEETLELLENWFYPARSNFSHAVAS